MADLGPSLANTHRPRGDALPIADALRALPLEAPPRSAWPAVAKTLSATPRRAARWPYALATAAALALALLLPVPSDAPSDAPSDTVAADVLAGDLATGTAGEKVDLPTLMLESAGLERLIAAVAVEPLQPADALVLGLAFEDELTGIDVELAAAAPGSPAAAQLWRQRVEILSRYAELQASRRLLAAAGQPFETTMVAVH